MRQWKYILQGHTPVPCSDPVAWAQWFEQADRRVARDVVEGVEISTVFLGLDHAFGLSAAPVVFETMIFGGPLDEHMWRYTTWDEAEAGHRQAVEAVRAELAARRETFQPEPPPATQRRIVLEDS